MIYAPFTGGPEDAKICIVGPAPGTHEAAHGGAFTGPAGRELTKFCANAGVNRAECRLENLFQFYPPDDDLDPFIKFGTKNVTKTPIYEEHAEALRSRLLRTNANIIVPMGNAAMYALTGIVGGVTKWRGSILESSMIPGRKVIPTVHPAAILKTRDTLTGYLVTYDLARAKRESEFPEFRLRNRNLMVEPTLEEVKQYLKYCMEKDEIAYDIETRGKHLSHISFATDPNMAICIPFVSGAKDLWSPEEEAEIMLLVAEVLEDTSTTKIGQNLSFDCSFMYRRFGVNVRPVQDTMIAAGIVFPDFPKGLHFLVSLYCDGEPYYKDDGKEWFRNPFDSDIKFRRYNAMDSAVLLEIFPKQREELQRTGNWESYLGQKELIHPLVYAGDRGIPVDIATMHRLRDETSAEIITIEATLRETMGADINIDSNQQLMNYFYVNKGIKPYMKRRKKGPSTPTIDEIALKRLASRGIPEAQMLVQYRKLTKLKGTYLETVLDDDNRFRCSYNPGGTVQARISSSKTIWGTGSNLQNQPPTMLKLFHADEGGIFVCQDLAQAENRVVAYEAVEMKMVQALMDGVDIHSLTGSLLHGVPLDQCTNDMRQDGKVANHGLNYGFGVDEFILRYELEREHGKALHEGYHKIYPGIEEWHATIRNELTQNARTLINCYGRKRKFLDDWSKRGFFEKAYNYKPQSAVATKINNDGVRFIYERQDLFSDVEFVNTVHDSIWYWMSLSSGYQRIMEVICLMKDNLEAPLMIKGREVTLPADTQIGFSLDKDIMLEFKASKADFSSLPALADELEAYVRETA